MSESRLCWLTKLNLEWIKFVLFTDVHKSRGGGLWELNPLEVVKTLNYNFWNIFWSALTNKCLNISLIKKTLILLYTKSEIKKFKFSLWLFNLTYRFTNKDYDLKRTVSVTLSDPPWKDWNATLSKKASSDLHQVLIKY